MIPGPPPAVAETVVAPDVTVLLEPVVPLEVAPPAPSPEESPHPIVHERPRNKIDVAEMERFMAPLYESPN